MSETYIGLMSGTSLDGVDLAIVEFTASGLHILSTQHRSFPTRLQLALFALNQPDDNEIDRAGHLSVELATFYASIVNDTLAQQKINPNNIRAIGCHGQTIRHRPDGANPFSLQLGSAAVLAHHTRIDVVADFRSADLAAGGQGAPLAPAFHAEQFKHIPQCVVLNLGGIANISVLPHPGNPDLIGLDTGPANALLDEWIALKLDKPVDVNGEWAASGTVHEQTLQKLMDDDYFFTAPPKSTGREYFNLNWVYEKLGNLLEQIPANDMQATLSELTAASISDAIKVNAPHCENLLVCGGGVHNSDLIHRLTQRLGNQISLSKTNEKGVDADFVEAVCFAWLAKKLIHREPIEIKSVTGASKNSLLGAIYPAPI